MYTLAEVFALFDMTPSQITTENLKRAKHKVLMTHPDKSRLPAEYFLFYKKAFDIVLGFYENQNKQNKAVPTEEIKYSPLQTNESNKATTKKVASVIGEMSPEVFQKQFNALFDANMSHAPDSSRNQWFSSEAPIYDTGGETVNVSTMGAVIDRIKESQSHSALIHHRGVEGLGSQMGTGLYDQDDESDASATAGQYVTCDPFSKLRYDDLRKVHKDQTVFAVSERDFAKVPQYTSSEQLMRERGKQIAAVTPLDKQAAERLLQEQERVYREQIMRKEHAAQLRTAEFSEKNKSVLSSFLRLM
jgi:hypothetical protein